MKKVQLSDFANSPKVGDLVFTKNDSEFNAKIIKIVGSKVTLQYPLGEDELKEDTIEKSKLISANLGGGVKFELPNHTLK